MNIHRHQLPSGCSLLTRADATEHTEVIRSTPGFDAAAIKVARGLKESHEAGRPLNFLMSDRGKIFCLLGALHLHARPDEKGQGLTPGRLAALCGQAGVCSRGRAFATLGALRWAGFVKPVEGEGRGFGAALAPTEKMLATLRERWIDQMSILALLDPRGRAAREKLEADPSFVLEIANGFFFVYRTGYRGLDHAPRLKRLAEHKNAMTLLIDSFLAQIDGTALPPIATIARKQGVSRAQVRKILQIAVEDGLLAIGEDESKHVPTPVLHGEMNNLLAAIMAYFSLAAASALAAGERPQLMTMADA